MQKFNKKTLLALLLALVLVVGVMPASVFAATTDATVTGVTGVPTTSPAIGTSGSTVTVGVTNGPGTGSFDTPGDANMTGITATWSGASGTGSTYQVGDTPILTFSTTLTASDTYATVGTGTSIPNFTASGDIASATYAASGDTATFTVTYNTLTATQITGGTITITKPATGGTPNTASAIDTATNSSEFTVSAATWTPNDATFAAITSYSVELTLTAKSGYTFAGLTGGTTAFSVTDATTVTNVATTDGGSTIKVTVAYPATGPATPTQITDNSLTITAPVTGATPESASAIDTATNSSQFTVSSVTWAPNDATFAASTIYTATITLTAKANYTFTGVNANTFSVANANTVTNTATTDGGSTITVTAAYLATGPTDTTPPVLQSATINGKTLVLTYNENLDTGSTPATTAFTVNGITAGNAISSVAVSGRTVTLTMANAASRTDTVTITYVVPGSNQIKDVAGNLAAAFSNRSVTNNTGAVTYATVTFNSQGGSYIASRTATVGGHVSNPGSPSRSGYNFKGWYTSPSGGTKWNFSSDIVYGDMTLYAQWTSKSSSGGGSSGGYYGNIAADAYRANSLTIYTTTTADGQVFNGSNTISVRFPDTSVLNFKSAYITPYNDRSNVYELEEGDYTLTSGSCVVTVKASALNQLSNGEYTLHVNFVNGYTGSVNFKVSKGSGSYYDDDDDEDDDYTAPVISGSGSAASNNFNPSTGR